MKQSDWWSVVVGGALAMAIPSAQAFELRFGANGLEGSVVTAIVNVTPLDIVATAPMVLGDGSSWRRFSGQAEGLFGWVFDEWDVQQLVWGTELPQELVVDNYLFANGASRTELSLKGHIWYGETGKDIGTVNLSYDCVCSDLFLSDGDELVEKAFERFDGITGLAVIEHHDLVWVDQPGGEGYTEWRLTQRQQIAFAPMPVPEPSVWALGLAGAGLVMLGARRRQYKGQDVR